MKKLVASILIIITIFNLIQPSIIYAANEDTSNNDKTFAYKEFMNDMDEGKTNLTTGEGENKTTRKELLTYSPTAGGFGANQLAMIGNVISSAIITLLSFAVLDFEPLENTFFTIYDIVFGNIQIFNANFLLKPEKNIDLYNNLTNNISVWYYSIRNVAIALSLCVLIYIGIRMAISTLSDEKAKYKKMLIGWLEGFVLIFLLHYIILISMAISSKLVEVIKLISPNYAKAECDMILNAFWVAFSRPGWEGVGPSIVLWILTFYEVKFFFLYIKRMLSVALLIIISPLISVTYPIDKVGDNKAQAFKAWLIEFEVNIFIQPLHALLYLIFIVTAAEIASRASLLAAIFFMGLSRGEKVIKGIFGARGMKSISSMGKDKKK